MPRPARTTFLVLIALGLVAAGAAALVLARAPRGIWTDHGSIRIDAKAIAPRQVLWTPATPLREGGDPSIATSADEYEPRLSPDGTRLVFVRGRPGANADLFITEWTPEGWGSPEPIASINTDADELGPAFSPDGRTLYFYSDRDGGLGGYDIWRARLEPAADRSADGADRWSTPTNLGPAVNTAFNEYGPAPDGDRLYFASNRPRADEPKPAAGADAWAATVRERRTRHDYDLFVALVVEGVARTAEPLSINTTHDEGAPAVSPAGDFLWFASDRPGGSGGYDLYRCRLRKGSLGAPERLDEAINSPADELDPALSADGFRLCFSSNRSHDAHDAAGGDAAPRDFDLWTSVSREVELESEPWPSLGSIIAQLWPWLLALLALLLLLLLLLHAFRDAAWRERFARLGLLAQCPLLSLAAHVLLAFLLALWQVGLGIGELLHGSSSTRVVLAGTSSGSVADQVLASPVSFESTPDVAVLARLPLRNPAPRATPELPPAASGLLAGALAMTPPPPPPTDRDAAVPSPPAPQAVAEERLAPTAPMSVAPASSSSPRLPAALPEARTAPSSAIDPVLIVAATPSATTDLPLPEIPARAAATVEPRLPPGTARPILVLAPATSTPAPVAPSALPSMDPANRSVSDAARVIPTAAPEPTDLPLPTVAVRASVDAEPRLESDAVRTTPTIAPAPPVPAMPAGPSLPSIAAAPSPDRSDSAPDLAAALRATASAVSNPATRAAFDDALRLPSVPPAPSVAAPPEPIESFAQRAPEVRASVLEATGGSDETEAAVARALAYFQRHQSSDGRWSAKDFAATATSPNGDTCDCGAPAEVAMDVATTGMVLLSYLGAGDSHVKDGPFRETIGRGLAWLVAGQSADGDLRRRSAGGADSLYGHTIATVALCEAYAMTRDPALIAPVRRAHAFLERRSTAERGGVVAPQDTSVLGWEVMALASARRAGLPVRSDAAAAARRWLDQVSMRGAPGHYAYRRGGTPSIAMTAEALFAQQLLDELDGRRPDEARERQSAAFVLEALPRSADGALSHHWYYATLALHRRQGEAWHAWNEALAPLLVERQRRDGCAEGSWDPRDPWSQLGGRLYQTAVCTLSLEVYYRYRATDPPADE